MGEGALSAEEFLRRIQQRFGSEDAARAWFEDEPLSGFGGATAQQLIAAGRASDVLELIAAIDAGVYA